LINTRKPLTAAPAAALTSATRHLERVVAPVIRWLRRVEERRVAGRLTAEVSCTGTDVFAPGGRPSAPGHASAQQM